ncbi:hypothetical protein M5K25_000728 [Dendrobium thyrsiflorum]|uniref:Aminotransferase-like plant mobile domain-containing protein n=1 Tax=Dendrobium thyrsiflorum TaxID=117978 RepID=A0ABD0VWS4_DENTH
MAENLPPRRKRRSKQGVPQADVSQDPPPVDVHPSIATLRGSHRAAHPDEGTILEAASHLLMVYEWPINCPRFMEGLRMLGLDCVSQLQYIRMDHNLLTALVERWSPQTNSFHLPVGEMSITLQDVALILGLHIDGPALVGHNVVGAGRRWLSWPDCCDDLLGQHPQRDVVYVDPFNPRVSSKFRMGQAQAQACLPLRWLRWTFYRDSYLDMNELDFWRHLRAYVLFLMGTYLLPDTSGCEIHLRFLPLLKDLGLFSTYSLGGAVLAHLYRELAEATKPKRANIAGCIHLLQIWCWERLHVGRPTLHVPQQVSLDGLSVGYRWNQQFIRQLPAGSLSSYRDELDGLLDSQVTWEPYTTEIMSQVPDICLSGRFIWLARVPLVSWTRVEWHLPDRVLRQFGFVPTIDVHPMEPKFVRVDGRGKSDTDWLVYYLHYIGLWEDRTSHITEGTPLGDDTKHLIQHYLQWFRSWATLYMLRPTSTPPTTYYPRSPSERYLRQYLLDTQRAVQPLLSSNDFSDAENVIRRIGELALDVCREIHIPDDHYTEEVHTGFTEDVQAGFTESISTPVFVDPYSMGAGPSSFQDSGPGHDYFSYPTQQHSPARVEDDILPVTVQVEQHLLRDRPVRPPQHYTPSSDALPYRGRRRR